MAEEFTYFPPKVPRLDGVEEFSRTLDAMERDVAAELYPDETSRCVGEIMQQCNGSYSSDSPLKVTFLASRWYFSLLDSSLLSTHLAIELAKFPWVQVTFLVPEDSCSEWEEESAISNGVTIVKAKQQPGFDDPVDWLHFPPQDFTTDIVIGAGERLGKIAQLFKERHKCKNIYVVSDPWEEKQRELEQLEIQIKQHAQSVGLVGLGETADLSVAIGPKMGDEMSSSLRFQAEKEIFQLTPGILREYSDVKHATANGTKFRILIFGGRNPDNFEEGLNTAAKAVAELKDKSYHLLYVGAAKGKHGQFIKKFGHSGVAKSQLTFRSLPKHEVDLKRLFCEADLAIMPSGEQGFGMVALAALSAGLPILVHGDSGFGEALKEVKFGISSTVDCEDAKEWAKKVEKVRKLDRKTRLEAAAKLRSFYDEMYSWEKQCGELLKMMLSMVSAQPHQA